MNSEPCTIFREAVYQNNTLYRRLPSVQPIAFNPEPSHVSWERLEALRLQRLGIPNRYSRHCNIVYNNQAANLKMEKMRASASGALLGSKDCGNGKKDKKGNANNSLAPFYTHEKRTCGFFFSRETDNRKKNFGIPPSNLVAWRSSNPVQ